MQSLQNKTVLITGASSGIGQACAYSFAALGANLILLARREERLRELADTLSTAHNIQCHTATVDIRDSSSIQQAVDSLPAAFQQVDILLNNAGLASGFCKVYEAEDSDFDAMFDTNVKGLLYLTRTIVPQMVQRNLGHIINIGSIAGYEVYPNGAVYCATKAAVKAISQGLKMDLLGTQVRVSEVDPGLVETEFSKVRFKGDDKRAQQVYANAVTLQAEDIADAVVYCATRPAHVNVSNMLVLATAQASATMVHREAN